MKVGNSNMDIKDVILNVNDLNIFKKEYKNILKNLNYKISDKVSNKRLTKKIQSVLNNEVEYKSLLKNLANNRKIKINNNSPDIDIINTIYRDIHKKKQKIIQVILIDLKLPNITLKQNIANNDLNMLKKLSKMKINDLRKLAKVRNIKNTIASPLLKEELIYRLFLTDKSLDEYRYMKIIKNSLNSKHKIMDKIIYARLELNKLQGFFTGKERDDIKKDINTIEKRVLSPRRLTSKGKDRLFKKILEIIRTLENKNKYRHINTFHKGLSDIEYLFADPMDYYKPILVELSFDNNYQRYTCRGDKI